MVMDSKRLLVVSDTHGSVNALKTVLNWAKSRTPPSGTICAAAFLGDGIADLEPAAKASGFFCDWKLVCGNNDYDYGHSTPGAAVFDFADNRFYICHGHRHSLYGGYFTLISAARDSGANVALFGHSHVPLQRDEGNLLLVNPGSVGRPRSRIGASFAVIECAKGEQPKAEFWGIGSHGEIKELKV